VGAGVAALGLGASGSGFPDVAAALRGDLAEPARTIVMDVRLPRILLAALVGAALSAAGAGFQAVLRNPLADPYILGVSGGAALGAIVFTATWGDPMQAPLGRPVAAFAGAMTTLVVLFGLTRARGRTGTLTLLLVGVVLNAFDSAVILFLVTAGDAARFQSDLFYLVGAIPSWPWSVLVLVAALVGAGIAALVALSHRMNLLALGEDTAEHLGIAVERTVWTVVAAASLVTASAVAFTGIVGFVGLMVPHAVRTAFGADHRLLVPASALGGAAFLVLADTAARTVLAPVELPVGVVTALVGGPFFLVLFHRRMREA
jgi:iron complex transport system permease protein